MTRRRKVVVVAVAVVFPFLLFAGYTRYWVKGAEAAVTAAAGAIADGRSVPGLDVDPRKAAQVAAALRGGYRVVGLDNIGLGFRAYEVKVRVRDGDQYNFDAIHQDGSWRLSCCTRFPAADRPD